MANPDLWCDESVQVFVEGQWYCPGSGSSSVGIVLQDSINDLSAISGVAGSVFAVMVFGAGLSFGLRIIGEALSPKQNELPPPPGPGGAGSDIYKGDRFL
jgi:hypothetical protein